MISALILKILFSQIPSQQEVPTSLNGIFPKRVSNVEICRAIREKANLHNVRSFRKSDNKKLPQVCKAIVEGAKKWKISPFLIAGVIWGESTFRASPPSGQVCRKVLKYWDRVGPNPPGWPKTVIKCWKVGVYEIGYMQVIWWHGDPKRGYQAVTGLKPKGRKYRRGLREVRTNIMVGSYELSKECLRCHKRGHNHRLSRMPSRIRKFFRKNPRLLRYFCVAHFNWGQTYWPTSKVFDQWGYPVRVLKRALTLARAVKKNRTKRGRFNGNLSSSQANRSNQRSFSTQGEKQATGQGHNHQDR